MPPAVLQAVAFDSGRPEGDANTDLFVMNFALLCSPTQFAPLRARQEENREIPSGY